MKFFLFFSIFHFIISFCNAQTHTWERTNPGGGGAYSTVGASASGIIVAGSDLSGAYRSLDNGLSWDVIGADKGLTETHVSGVGFHRMDGDILYLGTENGIFRSSDGGDQVNQVLIGGYITDIEFGTDVLSTGYAAYHPEYDSNNGSIYKSIDNGLSWSKVSENLPLGLRILKIIVDPNDTKVVYILSGAGRFACGPAEIFKSIDEGQTWENLTIELPSILDVAIDFNNSSNIFITTMNASCISEYYWTDILGDIYMSSNGGTTWGNSLSDFTGVILLDPDSPNTISLIDPREPYPWNDRSGTFTSFDKGNTFSQTGSVDDWDTFYNGDVFWAYSTSFNGVCKTLGEDLSNQNNYFWVNAQWIFGSNNMGVTFNNLFTNEVGNGFWKSRGFDNVNMTDISISQANPNIIYTAYFDIGIWRSLDKGNSWQSCNDGTFSGNWEGYGGNCATIIADPSRSHVVWASLSENQNGESPTYLLKNNNTGDKEEWELSNDGLPDHQIMGLSVDENSPSENRVVYVTGNKDVYKSEDDGHTWSLILDCNGCRFTAVDQFDGNVVYSGGENGTWRSMDGGGTWTDIGLEEMKAADGIDFWNGEYDGVFDIKSDPNHEGWVYVTALGTDKGLYKSEDYGTSWIKVLEDDFMRKVAILYGNSNVIYATSSSAFEAGGYDENSKGIWYTEDGGSTWVQQNQGMAYPFALAVAIDTLSEATVFVGSPGTGFQNSLISYKEPVGIDVTTPKNGGSGILIYPNPTSSYCKVISNEQIVSYKIYSLAGVVVQRGNHPLNNIIEVKKLIKGIYFVHVATNSLDLESILIIE